MPYKWCSSNVWVDADVVVVVAAAATATVTTATTSNIAPYRGIDSNQSCFTDPSLVAVIA